MTINKIHIIIAVAAVLTLAACDAHIETPDMTVRPGHVLCDDGTVLSYELYQTSGKRAVAIVFDTSKHGDTEVGHRSQSLCGHSGRGARNIRRHGSIRREHEHLCPI